MNVLVTGANGFVGSALCNRLRQKGHVIRGAMRKSKGPLEALVPGEIEIIDSINGNTDWSHALKGRDAVIHLAARAHILVDRTTGPMTEYYRTNVEGTENLARQTAQAGVRRFVFMSSVKVNGEGTPEPYTEADIPEPKDAYGMSKWEAEKALLRIAKETGLEVVVIRPPLVYGPGVKANFLHLMKVVNRGIPLPFAWVKNRRSLISLENLIDATLLCLTHPAAHGRTFLVSDGRDLATPELIRLLGQALGRPARLIPFPPIAMRTAAKLFRKEESMKRLLGSLTVNIASIRTVLGWSPPVTTETALQDTSRWFLKNIAEPKE